MKIVFTKTKNGIPVLKYEDIDACAELFLSKFQPDLLTSLAAVPVDSFIETFLGLQIDYQNLSEDKSILGMITFNDGIVEVYDESNNKKHIKAKRGTIIIDSSLTDSTQSGRCRFTLGHEPGHWIFHKHLYSDKKSIEQTKLANLPVASCFKCLKRNVGQINSLTGLQSPDDWKEWQADYFASALLMPKPAVHMLMEQYLKDASLTKEEFLNMNIFDIYMEASYVITSLAQVFDVSNMAAEVRLFKLGYINEKAIKFLCA